MQKQDHKENLNEPWGRLAWLCPAMYKLAFCSSSISKYSCLAPTSPLWHHSLCSHLASSCSPPPRFFSSSVLCCLQSHFFFASFCSSLFFPSPSPPSSVCKILSPLSCARFLQISQCKSSCSCTLLCWLHGESNKKLIDLNVIHPVLTHSLSNTVSLSRHLSCDLLGFRYQRLKINKQIYICLFFFFKDIHLNHLLWKK